MRKIFFAALVVVLVVLPIVRVDAGVPLSPPLIAPPLPSLPLRTAVILSSLEQVYPMGQYDQMIAHYLNSAGYQVTTLTNTAITIDFLLTQLNNYNIIIWRTDTYNWKHIEYWYVGELANSATETKYSSDFAEGWINGNAGILGVSPDFFRNHFTSSMLSNVKLMMLISTDSDSLIGFFLNAGASAVIFCIGTISLAFGLVDDVTNQLAAYLANGQSVYDAVFRVVSPFAQPQVQEDPLDSSYVPALWCEGDVALTIT